MQACYGVPSKEQPAQIVHISLAGVWAICCRCLGYAQVCSDRWPECDNPLYMHRPHKSASRQVKCPHHIAPVHPPQDTLMHVLTCGRFAQRWGSGTAAARLCSPAAPGCTPRTAGPAQRTARCWRRATASARTGAAQGVEWDVRRMTCLWTQQRIGKRYSAQEPQSSHVKGGAVVGMSPAGAALTHCLHTHNPHPANPRLLAAEGAVRAAGGCVARLAGLYHARRGAHTFFLKAGRVERWGGSTVNLLHYEDGALLVAAVRCTRAACASLRCSPEEHGRAWHLQLVMHECC